MLRLLSALGPVLLTAAAVAAALPGAGAGAPDPAADAGPVDAGEPAPRPDPTAPAADSAPATPDATPAGADPGASATAPATSPPPAGDPDAARTAPSEAAPAPDGTEPAADATAAHADPDAAFAPGDAGAGAAKAEVGEGTGKKTGLGFGGVPAINYDADNGFGFGVIASLYGYDGVTDPYRIAVTLQIFMTSKLVQDHNIQVDWLKVLDFPLRLNLRVGYLQSLTQNYCGLGGDVTCSPAVARDEARALDLHGKARQTFEHDYYLRRFMNPYAVVNGRFALLDRPKEDAGGKLRVELLAGYRGFYFIPGNWFEEDGLGPYPGSLYAQHFPDGEPGFSSVIQGGIMVDTRDNEPAPTEGVWAEATARGASPVWGSRWSWAGGNVTLRGYAPLLPDHTLVLASRLVGDVVVGDPPIQELARVGGSLDYYAFGGADIGRGIRAQRYMGRIRVLNQTELRWRFFDFTVFEQNFGFTLAGLVDSGITGVSVKEPGSMPLHAGVGTGLRLSWNENFVIRADVAASPVEKWAPAIYIVVNNPF
jgi:hypothetical protein